MSLCLSGGGEGCGFELGIMKSSSTSTRISNNSSSPSSTLSESSNCPIFICTRKPRTQRKRPNQKYNEAAALLSTAYPDIFSSKIVRSPLKCSSNGDNNFFIESSELLLPFRPIDHSEFLLHHDPVAANGRLSVQNEPYSLPSSEKPCQSPGETEIQSNPMEFFNGYLEEFDADSILNEEMEEGIIDAIMGNTCADAANNEPDSTGIASGFGGKFDSGFGFGRSVGVNALRNVNGVNNWWDFPFPTVDVLEIPPKFSKSALTDSAEKKRKNAEKPPKPKGETKHGSESNEANPDSTTLVPKPKPKLELLLKLNYDGVLSTWSGRGSPFSAEGAGSHTQGNDVSVSFCLLSCSLYQMEVQKWERRVSSEQCRCIRIRQFSSLSIAREQTRPFYRKPLSFVLLSVPHAMAQLILPSHSKINRINWYSPLRWFTS